jgi:hypothetical protein
MLLWVHQCKVVFPIIVFLFNLEQSIITFSLLTLIYEIEQILLLDILTLIYQILIYVIFFLSNNLDRLFNNSKPSGTYSGGFVNNNSMELQNLCDQIAYKVIYNTLTLGINF